MKYVIITALSVFAIFSLSAQTDVTAAHESANNYIRQGDYNNALVVLNRATQQSPNNLELLKDLAFTYYLQRNFSKALAEAKKFPDRADADVQSYQILGMIYKGIEERKDCEKMYREGIKRFPKSGVLYNEYGEVLGTKDGDQAIALWEKGIEVDPNYSGNYYNACKYYYSRNNKPWSALYGELFVNLESYSRRTSEIRDVIAEDYKQIFADVALMEKQAGKNEFMSLFLSINQKNADAVAQGITVESLSALRTRFISDWFGKQLPKFPFRLFDYQNQLIKDGMFDAYNAWLFGDTQNLKTPGDWQRAHADEYNRFLTFQKGRIFKVPAGQYYQSPLK